MSLVVDRVHYATSVDHNYNFSPIQGRRSIRILRLYGNSEHHSTLHCDLIEVSLDNAIDYEAISYEWREQIPSRSLKCEGKQLLVTENCEAALKRFRPHGTCETRLLWIDGICIDQASTATRECSHQVGMMGEIYSKAQKVLVWLGEEAAEEERDAHTFAFLSRIAELESEPESEMRHQHLINLTENMNIAGKF